MIESVNLVWSSCLFILPATAKRWFQNNARLISIFRLFFSTHMSTTYSERVLISVHRIFATYTVSRSLSYLNLYRLNNVPALPYYTPPIVSHTDALLYTNSMYPTVPYPSLPYHPALPYPTIPYSYPSPSPYPYPYSYPYHYPYPQPHPYSHTYPNPNPTMLC